MAFQIATKKNIRARIGLLAPSGGGKTFTGLRFLFAMMKLGMAKKVGVIDTEHESASKYVAEFPPFLVNELNGDFSPQRYIDALKEAAEAGIDALMVDSLSHAWAGQGGALAIKDKVGRRSGNDFTAWGAVTPLQNAMIEALLSYPGHLIVTLRQKQEYVQDKDAQGKTIIRKIGLQPVQRDGMEYEFDVVGDLDVEHHFAVSKTRCKRLDGFAMQNPDESVIVRIKEWIDDGAPAEVATPHVPAAKQETAPVPVVVPAPITPPTSAGTNERPALQFARDLRAADSLEKLEAVSNAIGPAFRAEKITAEERGELVMIWADQKQRISAGKAA